MGDIQDDIENKAEKVKDNSADPHLGDAMDDADLEPEGTRTAPVTDDGELEAVGQDGATQAGGPTESNDEQQQDQGDGTEQEDSGNALDDVDLEPPSS